MEKRSSIYSGRPDLKFAFDMCGWSELIGQLPNNDQHRLYRRSVYKPLGSKAAVSKYHLLQEAMVGRALWRIKQNRGRNLSQDFKTQTGGLILRILYDYKLDPYASDPLITLADRALDQFSQATVPGRWLVDLIPIIAHTPEWFPGVEFKRLARIWRRTLLKSVNIPYNFAKKQKDGNPTGLSFVSQAIDQAKADNGGSELTEEQERAIKYSAVSMYVAGQDTSALTMNSFFLAMSMFPEVQHKAQEEIDNIVGTGRLPTFSDREQLGYIDLIVDEALRWHPLVPMSLPHASDKDDVINGYHIPKRSILMPNEWWFTRNPEVYHDPESFKPERYREPYVEPSPTDFVFGFGRRVCPGRFLATSTLFLTCAQVLAVFNIRPARDEDGKEVENLHTFSPGLIAQLGPFKVDVTPRSEAHAAMIDQLMEKFPWEESNSNDLVGLEDPE